MTDLKEFQPFEQRPIVRERNVSFLLETLEFFEISYGSCQPLNFLPYLSLTTQYFIIYLLNTVAYLAYLKYPE